MLSQPVRILAVDDVPDNLFILESILADINEYDITCVEDGKTAIEKVVASPPDLILLDVMMPGIDGYEVTRRIRENKSLPYIPILLVTAHDHSSLAEGLDSGADDFIRKPFDIDELMARVRSLIRLKHSLDEQSEMIRQRDDFVARLTHDLRTPLVAANRMLSLCLEDAFGTPPDSVKEALSSIITNNENLLQMTNTLLQVYRHEAGHKKLICSAFSAYTLVNEVVKELKPLADEKGIDLSIKALSVDGEVQGESASDSYWIEGDRIELRRLLTNLLGNAIKFTDSGYVAVQLSINPKAEHVPSAEAVEIAIKDTGPGIEEEAQKRIFEWFYQGTHMKSGSGLGLHLSKRIAEMHKGTLKLESEVGQGSTFTLMLPTASCA
ncbi:ATPase, histidine kinase-, DNA gyrase B-, and HSP90-like domain protein [Synechococcus sp. PCC 7335]|uniref:hybrid sensor histidine kinase/response regulator n=1 Tax=Synechococcus sp. (strain ATCC 29403 / PCC 7335) TaxID=91464 RepID=UPI00017EBFA0|nr:hybrid sensor histidine kinase/response regulator [Synechococcus sp. PCC 7335]EDX87612.1 ATPase, histidine kinase-, DNA gyrase B-, and HSP90-like domain protein [Synechococcus sp. PCC 7335]